MSQMNQKCRNRPGPHMINTTGAQLLCKWKQGNLLHLIYRVETEKDIRAVTVRDREEEFIKTQVLENLAKNDTLDRNIDSNTENTKPE